MASYFASLKPNPKTIVSDVVSGFAAGLFSIPEGMAYASLAGVGLWEIIGKENIFLTEPILGV